MLTRSYHLRLFILPVLALFVQSCSMRHFRLQAGSPNINSYKSFDNFEFKRSAQPYCFDVCNDRDFLGNRIMVSKGLFSNHPIPLQEYLQNSSAISLTIIRNDSILYEYFREGYDEQSIFTSFSVAKSFVSATMGVAIKEGFIQNVEEPITRYLPELIDEDPRYREIKIRHVLNHTAGIDFPSFTWEYYNNNHQNLLKKMRYDLGPGVKFSYDNGNTMLATFIIERATGRKFQDYFNEKIWKKIGAESEMLWSMDGDKQSNLKTFCCMNGLASDFAKFGRLYLKRGNWNGEQIIPESWIDESIQWTTYEASSWGNHYFWWLGPKKYGYYYAAGLYGQYIIIYPEKNVIITRFAKRSLFMGFMWDEQLMQILDQL